MLGLCALVMFAGYMLLSDCGVCGNMGNAAGWPNSLNVGFTRRSRGNSAGIVGKHEGDRQCKAIDMECVLC